MLDSQNGVALAANSLPENVSITPIPAFTDNYIWCIHNQDYAVVVDPGDANPVIEYCQRHQLTLIGILITHHHHDHTGGILSLHSAYVDIPVIGPVNDKIKGLTKQVKEGAVVSFPRLSVNFSVFEVPGHTLDHIAFVGHGGVFCGDTLFSAGCGRMFEGTPEQFTRSLTKLSRLADTTKVYCTHEYTLANVTFARHLDVDNNDLAEYQVWAQTQREQNLPTLPTTIETQKAINPFLRCHVPALHAVLEKKSEQTLPDAVAVFAQMRRWKDEF